MRLQFKTIAMKLMPAICVLLGIASASAQPGRPPNRMLWHWFSNGDVRFVQPRQAGVAFHALSIALKGDSAPIPYPRRSPMPLAPGVYRMAVVRIEIFRPGYTPAQLSECARTIHEVAAIMNVPAASGRN